MLRRSAALTTCLLLLSASITYGKETAEVVYDKVHPAVVSLRNAEGSGTGIVLDRKGLILTNAHVVMSPLPFQASVDVRSGGTLKTATYKKVTLVGVHPKYDLALLKIDPRENRGVLTTATLSHDKVKPGRSVYVIGNPGGGGEILTKTITTGLLSGIRQFDGLSFLQVSAPINPGNSGGPLCDADGTVIGIVTFKFTDVENIGFAIPTSSFSLKQFVPPQQRKANAQQVRELTEIGAKYLEEARKLHQRFGGEDGRVVLLRSLALRAYWFALMESPGNSSLYYTVGMIYRTLDEDELALAYLVRSVELEPWGDSVGNHFREIGFALVKLKRIDEGLDAYNEGIAKHPTTAGKIWEDLAITHINRGEWIDAAYAAKAALSIGDSRKGAMQNLYTQATGRMNAQQQAQFGQRLKAMDRDLKSKKLVSDKARAAKRKYVTAEFVKLIEKLGTLAQPEDAANQLAEIHDPADAGAATTKPDKPEPKPTPKPPKDPALTWIERQLDRAQLYISAKNKGKAKEILESIIDRYPEHPKTAEARKRLKRLK